jgi:tetratricopeptide (TPR) repeat protein
LDPEYYHLAVNFWMKSLSLAFFLILLPADSHAGHGHGQEPARSKDDEWHALIDRGDKEGARKLCSPWLDSDDPLKRAEAHKCLANVELCGQSIVSFKGNEAGGGSLGEGYKPEALEKALAHLEQALKLSPQDLSIHQGRLHLLESAGRFDDMEKALDESCAIYKGKDALEAWLAYTAELFEAGQYHGDLTFLRVLEKRYPSSHDVLGNIGAVLTVLKEDKDALAYLRKAVEMAPTDSIDNWNLAREYEFTGNVELAEEWYQKALKLDKDPDTLREKSCYYGGFVEKGLHNLKRACQLQKANCVEKEHWTACPQ